MNSHGIGATLRQERLRQGLSVSDVAESTRIQARFLEAIENDDLSVFPGLVFARNFVRQYAKALELDSEPLLAAMPRLDQETVRLPDPPSRPRAQRTRLRSPLWSSLGWSAAAVIAIGGAWAYHEKPWKSLSLESWLGSAHANATVRADLKSAPVATVLPQQGPLAETGLQTGSSPASAEMPPSVGPIPGESHDPLPAAPAVIAALSPADSKPVQVTMTASEAAWVSVTADSKSAFVGILRANESRSVSAAGAVRILTGNAGGLSISLNGKTIDPIGPKGQVRTVRLTAEGPELLTKAPMSGGSVQEGPL